MDDLSNLAGMAETTLTWKLVDETATKLGAQESARMKWRQRGRGVPAIWRIKIAEALMHEQIQIALSDFDKLDPTPGRIAA